MKKLLTTLTLTSLSLMSCDSAQKRKETNLDDIYKVTDENRIVDENSEIDLIDETTSIVLNEDVKEKRIYKAIFNVKRHNAILNKNNDKLFVISKDIDSDLGKNIKSSLEKSLKAHGFTLTSSTENNVEVIVENTYNDESYMPQVLNLTFKKFFKGEVTSIIKATMRTEYNVLNEEYDVFINKLVKVILEGKTLKNKSIEWIVE